MTKPQKIEGRIHSQFYGKVCCNGDYCKDGHEAKIIESVKELLHSYRDLLIEEINKLPAHSSDFVDGAVLEKSEVL